MILVCGGLADGVTELVCARLQDCGYPYRLLDLAHYPVGYRVAWHWTDAGPVGTIAGPDWALDLDAITGVYVRFLGPEGRLPPQGDPEAAAALRFEADAGLMALLEDLPCPVVNRIGGGMSNNSKPYQALLLRRAGLKVPATLVTSDPAAARAFQAEHGEVIYKSASGIRSIVRRLGPDQLARLGFLRDGPAQFQAFVPGRNVRVHTVGDVVFATRIETDAVDYRYAHLDGLDVVMTPATLPAGGGGRLPTRRPRPRPPLRRDRPQGDPGRGVRLLRDQPLPGLHLLRAPHRPTDQHGARRPAQRHGPGRQHETRRNIS